MLNRRAAEGGSPDRLDLPPTVGEWREGWPLALAGVAGTFLASLAIYSAGLFILPMEKAYGWSRSEISLGLTIFSLVAVVGTPVLGLLVDRVGPRRIALPACFLYLIAFAMLGLAGDSVSAWCGLWVLVALAALGTKPNVFGAAIASRFERSRGMALGVSLIGASLSMAVMPILTNILIREFGVRWSFPLLSLLTAVVSLPLLWLFFYGATDRRQRPTVVPATIGNGALSPGTTLAFCQLIVAALIVSTTITAVAVHMVPLLSSKGLLTSTAAALAGPLGAASAIGRLAGGWLIDRFSPRLVAGFLFACPIPAFYLLLSSGGELAPALLAIVVIGFSLGAEVDVIAFLTARLFGVNRFGSLFGILSGLIALGGAIGPQAASAIFDTSGSYDLLLKLSAPALALATSMVLTLPVRHQRHVDQRGSD